jgi:4-alpha-glucanotransferase
MKRAAGILLHPTSLPSRFGIGDFGDEAFAWISMLKEAGQTYWQFFPLGPTGHFGSPYQCMCSFAGNPLLISPVKLVEKGLLSKDELQAYAWFPEDVVDFPAVAREKKRLFRLAFRRFKQSEEFTEFCGNQRYWLDDYTLFSTLSYLNEGRGWTSWDVLFKLRNKTALESFRMQHRDALRFHAFLQFVFHEQWAAIRAHARKEDIRLVGDVPIYVALNSSDAWASPELFEFDADANPLRVAGVPPDYYAETGQLWGNPVYRWDEMKKDGYAWWIRRMRKTFEFVDIIRLDHFRGFESFWAVPWGSKTAEHGEWGKGPGESLFDCLKESIGSLPFIAEDLGIITDEVIALRDRYGFPGTKVLQFAFDGNPDNPHLPYNIFSNSVVYTGTHDNDTTVGWLNTLSGVERRRVDAYIASGNTSGTEDLIRLAYSTTANLSIIPMQDVLGLDSRSRMNVPGRAEGNWNWRCKKEDFVQDKLLKVKELAVLYGRNRLDNDMRR